MAASAITDWISAISTAVLGLLGLAFTGWQWHASGFRPKVSALVDARHQAIALRIVNRGRGSGIVHHVAVIHAQIAVDVIVEGFESGTFVPTALPGFATIELILMAPNGTTLLGGHQVKVSWGKKTKVVKPLPVDVGLFGMRSVLPPSACG